MLKMAFVSTIAKGFVLREAAAADRYHVPSAEIVFSACFVYQFKISFQFE
jgi:hypothetical protein